MIINTLTKPIDYDKVRYMGYSSAKTLLPRQWLQFADDSAITTSTEKDNHCS